MSGQGSISSPSTRTTSPRCSSPSGVRVSSPASIRRSTVEREDPINRAAADSFANRHVRVTLTREQVRDAPAPGTIARFERSYEERLRATTAIRCCSPSCDAGGALASALGGVSRGLVDSAPKRRGRLDRLRGGLPLPHLRWTHEGHAMSPDPHDPPSDSNDGRDRRPCTDTHTRLQRRQETGGGGYRPHLQRGERLAARRPLAQGAGRPAGRRRVQAGARARLRPTRQARVGERCRDPSPRERRARQLGRRFGGRRRGGAQERSAAARTLSAAARAESCRAGRVRGSSILSRLAPRGLTGGLAGSSRVSQSRALPSAGWGLSSMEVSVSGTCRVPGRLSSVRWSASSPRPVTDPSVEATASPTSSR